MDTEIAELNETLKFLMEHMGDTQTSLGKVINLAQPGVGNRLRGGTDDPPWKYVELLKIADHWGIPITTMLAGKTAASRWLAKQIIDLSDQPRRSLDWNAVEQLDLFSSEPLAADVRAGGVLWEFSDRTSVDTLTNVVSEVSSRERQLVA